MLQHTRHTQQLTAAAEPWATLYAATAASYRPLPEQRYSLSAVLFAADDCTALQHGWDGSAFGPRRKSIDSKSYNNTSST